MTYLLSLDQGTSSSRAIVFDRAGRIVRLAQREFTQHFPAPGLVEHDPEEIWSSQLAVTREVFGTRDGVEILPAHIAAVGITNQRETTVVWDRATGRAIHPAIVWQDRRTEPLCAQWRAQGLEHDVRARTGLVVDAYFSGSKIRWLLDHVDGARARAERGELAFGTIDTWLLWKLSGGRLHVTDTTNASRTMLYDVVRGDWDDALLQAVGVPRAMLPQVFASSHDHGPLAGHLFDAPLHLAGIAGDQQSALFGQTCFEAGGVKNTYGTGCFMLMHTGSRFVPSRHGLVSTAAATQRADAPRYALEGSVFVAGAVVQWLRDNLHAVERAADVEALAASVPDSGGVTLVPAFTGLGAPWWRPDARGAVFGLTRGTTLAHLARASLESIAFQSAALLDAMQRDAAPGDADEPAGDPAAAGRGAPAGDAPASGTARPAGGAATRVHELRVDGGASANDLLMQFQADLCGIPVVRPQMLETTALGAAYLAGLARGVYRDEDEIRGNWQVGRVFEPRMSRDEAAARIDAWDRAVRAVP